MSQIVKDIKVSKEVLKLTLKEKRKKKIKMDEVIDTDVFLMSMEYLGVPCEEAAEHPLYRKVFDEGMAYAHIKYEKELNYWKKKYQHYMQKEYVPKVLQTEYASCMGVEMPDDAYEIGGFFDGIGR